MTRSDQYPCGRGFITFGSFGFFCKSWFKTSTHSANLPDWKCKAASLARATVTVKTPSSASVPEEASRLAVDDGDDDGKSRDSMARSSNRNTNRIVSERVLGKGERSRALKLSEEK